MAQPWSYVPPVSLWPRVSFQALPAALPPCTPQLGCSRPDPAPAWGRLLFTFKPVWWLLRGGDVVGWRLAGLCRGLGMSRELGSCPGTILLCCQPLVQIWDNSGSTLCHLRAGCGASLGQQRGQDPCHSPCRDSPCRVAGGDRSHCSAPSEISPCTSSFIRAAGSPR